ncbi:aminotransferase class III-fold pyridoxal phosphate-dependent enzyme [Gammaproteobacteria bacterium]|nr:aminotransferase class III-fold pyridoxal phosphate-dependent enzyme [Gammaproteobacteria bacterium]
MKKKINLNKGNLLHSKALDLIPGANSLLSKRRELFAPNIWPAYFKSAKGIKVEDLDGNKFLDFSHFGVGTNTLGYGNKEVDEEVIKCVKNGNMSTLNPPEEVFLAEKLVNMHPWSSMAKFARTGGEANSMAVRIARSYTGKSKIAFCGYHGWHDWYLSANIKDKKNLDDQLMTGLSPVGVPKELSNTSIPFRDGDINKLEEILKAGDVAAIKMEVMRSSEPSISYLKDIRRLANKYKCLLIFDECTSGFRETFGGLHLKYKIQPDICVLGKTLGNGYAITSVIGTKKVMLASQSTFISSTFFTERIGYVAALKTLEQMEKYKSWEVITKKGKLFKKLVNNLSKKYNLELDITGMDALVCYNFKNIDQLAAKTFVSQEMLKHNFLAGNLFYPSIMHTDQHIKNFFEALEKVYVKLSSIVTADGEIIDHLDDQLCHSSFQRLN